MAVVAAVTIKIGAPTAVTTIRKALVSQNGLPESQNVSLKELMVMSQLRFSCRVVPDNVMNRCSDFLHEFNSSLNCVAEWVTDKYMRALYVT